VVGGDASGNYSIVKVPDQGRTQRASSGAFLG
jgi:hypothetical protein